MSIATSKLLLKNMPCSMLEFAQLIQEANLIIPRSLNAFGRRRALLDYADAEEAQSALEQLLGLNEILDKPLRVSSFGPRSNDSTKPKLANKSTQATAQAQTADASSQPEIKKYVQKLYARNNQCDFMQPPPPYLRYAYPPINADILAAIGNTLKNDKRFYVQVLHLMNRMNLMPPFGHRPAGLHLPAQQSQSVTTQTEVLQSESESELESDEEHKQQQKQPKLKRPAESAVLEQYRKRARQMLQVAASEPGKSAAVKENMDVPAIAARKIELKLPTTLPVVNQLPAERLSSEQLQELPVYKNYKVGEPSNKLYIKNLDKSITESQLRTLYAQYAPAESLDIKVMQQGRMKGQAFVTFLDSNNQTAAAAAVVVAKALTETNGLLWHQKPMIVCYGKQQQQQSQQL
ncbi:U11/U12 small nuclear ribonucleoprotein 65 kDa protein [Drosophila novamexicana]|uniref:U11/U12 small nuclear ribonucleoprotein 65 kDa protein n=1 Tax=Drosophila novamexicana TaxID=47314 RepID=UPI0011E5A525|nr:U11/U12 small nuclear ribonucleoprotein 65 kDa protein [Drosophila novamexicana]